MRPDRSSFLSGGPAPRSDRLPVLRGPRLRRPRIADAGPIDLAPLTIIQAGLGMGKTTAAVHIAEAHAAEGLPVVWGDLTGVSFADGAELETWLRRLLQRAGLGTGDVAEDLFGMVATAGAFVLVLDGYDIRTLPDLGVRPDLGERIVRALEALPDVCLIVSGPMLGSIALPSVRSRVPVMFIDDRALAFTEGELDQLLTLRFPEWDEKRREDARRGFALIGDGWPLAANHVMNTWHASPEGSREAVARESLPVFAAELLDGASGQAGDDGERAEAIRAASYFAEISAEMLHTIMGIPPARAEALLAELAAGLLPQRRDRDGTTWFSHHPIVSGLLQQRERASAGGPTRKEERSRLARALARSHPEEAQRAAAAAEDWPLLEVLLGRNFSEELLTIDSWLDIDPVRVGAAHRARLPLVGLLSLMGHYQRPRGRNRTLRKELRAIVARATGASDPGTFDALVWAFVGMVAARLSGDEPGARGFIAKIEEAVEALADAEASEAHATITSMMVQVVLTLIYLEDWDAAEIRLSRLRAVAVESDRYVQARLGGLLCAIAVIRGDVIAARRHLREWEEILELNPYLMRSAGDNYRFAAGVVLMEAGDFAGARSVLGDFVFRTWFNETWAIRAWIAIQLCRAEEGADAAYDMYLRQLEAARPSGVAMPNNRRMLHALGASLQWQTGRGAVPPSSRIGDDLASAYRAVDRGDLVAGIAISSGVAVAAQRTGFHRLQCEALLLLAETERVNANPAAAAAARSRANALLQKHGMMRLPFLTLPDPSPAHAAPPRVAPLTKTEILVLRQVAESGTAAAAAKALHLSSHTVRDHLKAIYQKLGVNRRNDALVAASRLGLLLPVHAGRPAAWDDQGGS